MINLNYGEVRGWGRTHCVNAWSGMPISVGELRYLLNHSRTGNLPAVARGAGKTYGDLATICEGMVIDLSRWVEPFNLDDETETAIVPPGLPLGKLVEYLAKKGWMISGIPGSPDVTVGGAIGNNVHGKDSSTHGAFGWNVTSLSIMFADGNVRTLSNNNDPDLFRAVIGGFGLLGIVVDAKLMLNPLTGNSLAVRSLTFSNMESLEEMFGAASRNQEMAFAWIDGFDPNARGFFELGHRVPEVLTHHRKLSKLRGRVKESIPLSPIYALSRTFMCDPIARMTNSFSYLRAKSKGIRDTISFKEFNFPITNIFPEHSALFRGGLYEIQAFVPKNSAFYYLRAALDLCNNFHQWPWLCSMKQHRDDNFLMSFAGDGFSIALNYPGNKVKTPAFKTFFKSLVDLTIAHQGRFNLSKDHLLNSRQFSAMYPNARQFMELKAKVDPDGLFGSDMSRRLGLSSY